MTAVTRRQALAATSVATLFAALPAWAQDPAADTTGAQWDLTELYPSDAAWDTARRQALAALPAIAAERGKLGTSAAEMARILVAQSDLVRQVSRIYTYISLKADADLRISANQAKRAQVIDLATQATQAIAWTAPEVLALGEARVAQFVAADATLRTRFDVQLRDILRQAPHTLTANEEALLAGTGAAFSGPSDIREQLVASDIPWPTVTLSTGRQVRLDDQAYTLNRDAPNRADRKLVFDRFWATYGQFAHSFGAAYLSHLKADVFLSRSRHYPTSLARSLASSDVPEAVYRTLVAETARGLPQLHRYFDIRRRLLRLPDMHYYDIYPPLVSLDRRVGLAEMRTTVLQAVTPLGPEYQALLARSTAARWMDPLPRPGKSSGAYMNDGAYDVHPYLLLNLGENYEGMTTYAHEWGHAMHSLLANRTQVYEKTGYPLFLAEIASTCNEQLLAAYMVRNARTPQEKLFYLGQQLEGIRGTFFRQTMFAEFELAVHDRAEAGDGLSGEAFTALYLDLLRRYHGPNVAIDPVYAAEWAYIPHFYNSFYVYQYATSISAASYFARSILGGGARERDNYLNVLRAGGSDYPVPILRRAGLDMASAAPYQAIIRTFSETLDQVEGLMRGMGIA